MSSRAIWSGAISFGLVNVPVRMYSAIDEQDLHFHLLHLKDDSRIGYEKVCKKEGKVVPDDEIGTAYEVSDGTYVYLSDEDFEAAQPKGYHSFDLVDFVALDEIDPINFERTYFLGPAEGAQKVYAVLTRAMDRSGLAGIGMYVMRNKQHLGCLRVRDRVLTLSKLYFADEIRPHADLKPDRSSVSKQELEMAGELIDRFTTKFDIRRYRDDYRDALLAVIKAKQKGKEVRVEPVDEEAAPSDLMTALRESVARHSRTDARRPRRGKAGGLEDMTKSELERRAKGESIKGYSRMTKDELVTALR